MGTNKTCGQLLATGHPTDREEMSSSLIGKGHLLVGGDRLVRCAPYGAMGDMARDRRARTPLAGAPPTRLHHGQPLAGGGQREGQPSPAFCPPIHLRVRPV